MSDLSGAKTGSLLTGHTGLFWNIEGTSATGGFAEQELNKLETQSGKRFVGQQIEFDDHGHAILPPQIAFHDPTDRKFIALAMQFDPYAPIYNATDTDWTKEKLAERGFAIYELCPDYIQSKLAGA